MSAILGTVENGVVKLPPDAGLADGTTVRVEAVAEPTVPAGDDPDAGKSFYEVFEQFVGCVKDGPSDLAANHDHYLYGTPKQEEPSSKPQG